MAAHKTSSFLEKTQNQAAEALLKRGFTPNQLTLATLVLAFFAGWAFAMGHLFLGTLIAIAAGLGDVLDGAMARKGNQTTQFGAFLDSTVDRYADFFLFGGLSLYFMREGQGLYAMLSLGSLAGTLVTSYAKARAENFIDSCNVGIFTRPVRCIVLLIGTLLGFILPLVLWILFIGTNVTAVQRILHTRKALKGEVPGKRQSGETGNSDEGM